MGYRKLGRTSSQRKAMLRDLTSDLIINERIVTTEARAKEVRKTTEKMITLGKKGDLHARRQAAEFVRNEVASLKKKAKISLFNQFYKNYLAMLLHVTLSVKVDTHVS